MQCSTCHTYVGGAENRRAALAVTLHVLQLKLAKWAARARASMRKCPRLTLGPARRARGTRGRCSPREAGA